MLGLPYVAGLSEPLDRINKTPNIHIYYKPANTIRSMVAHLKDRTPEEHQYGTIYNITHTLVKPRNTQPEIQRTYKP